jgi:Tol biopolymer transport system component
MLLFLVTSLIVMSGCGTSSKPSKPGVYLKSSDSRVELTRVKGDPPTQGVPETKETLPVIEFFLPLDDVKQVQMHSLSERVDFDTLAAQDQVYAIKPSSPLKPGINCMVLGGPSVLPTDVSYWCFQVVGGNSIESGPIGTVVAATPIANVSPAPTESPSTPTSAIPIVSAHGKLAVLWQQWKDFNTDSFNGDLVVMNADGSGLSYVTTNRSLPSNSQIAWSPDATKFAFDSRIKTANTSTPIIAVVNVDGTGLTQLTGVSGSFPVWSPDGKQIGFQCVNNNKAQMCIVNADGTGLRTFGEPSNSGYSVAWSPDGTQIAIGAEGNISVINTDGTGLTRLTEDDNSFAPMWSPDGTRIAFYSQCFGCQLSVMNADGSEKVNLTKNKGTFLTPKWSPDGTKIAFSQQGPEYNTLFSVKADGSEEPVELAHGKCPAWSPDATQIAFTADVTVNPDPQTSYTGGGIFIMNADGSAQTQITRTDGYTNGCPLWHP